MSETIIRAYTVPETGVADGFEPMLLPYQRVLGATANGLPTAWDRRPANSVRNEYNPPDGFGLVSAPGTLALPEEAGQVIRTRKNALTPEQVPEDDMLRARNAYRDVLTLISDGTPFTELTTYITQWNIAAERPATYIEALYALELARLVTAEDFQHRIACYELSLTAGSFCITKGLSVDWCLGTSLQTNEPHAWLEVGGKPVRGEADEIIEGVYQRLLRLGTDIAQ